jgi:hypothetical protein
MRRAVDVSFLAVRAFIQLREFKVIRTPGKGQVQRCNGGDNPFGELWFREEIREQTEASSPMAANFG